MGCMGRSVKTQKHWLIQIEEAIIQCMAAPSISIHYNNILCSLNDKGKNGTATFLQYNMVNTSDQDHIPGLSAL